MQYLKVMFSKASRYDGFEYKINDITTATTWNPNAKTPPRNGWFKL